MAVASRTAEEIRNDVREQLAWDTRVDSSDINVEVADATVILSGAISDYTTFHSIEDAARDTSGVLEVTNNLTTESQDPPDNAPTGKWRADDDLPAPPVLAQSAHPGYLSALNHVRTSRNRYP